MPVRVTIPAFGSQTLGAQGKNEEIPALDVTLRDFGATKVIALSGAHSEYHIGYEAYHISLADSPSVSLYKKLKGRWINL